MKTEIRDPLKWKRCNGKITLQAKATEWTDRLNDDLRKLGIDNSEEAANNRKECIRLCGAVKSLFQIY